MPEEVEKESEKELEHEIETEEEDRLNEVIAEFERETRLINERLTDLCAKLDRLIERERGNSDENPGSIEERSDDEEGNWDDERVEARPEPHHFWFRRVGE